MCLGHRHPRVVWATGTLEYISHGVFLWTLSRVINSFITCDKALRGTLCNSSLNPSWAAGQGLYFTKAEKLSENLRYLRHIRRLDLSFRGPVVLPEWMNDIEIKRMTIRSTALTDEEKEQIKRRFPHTELKFSTTLLQGIER